MMRAGQSQKYERCGDACRQPERAAGTEVLKRAAAGHLIIGLGRNWDQMPE